MDFDPHNLKGQYILDADHNAIPERDLFKWGRWMQEGNRRVGNTEVGRFFVSTVFLGIDHNFIPIFEGLPGRPLLFETMVFEKRIEESNAFGKPFRFHPSINYQRRCSTWKEAKAQHQRTVELIARLERKTVYREQVKQQEIEELERIHNV